MVTITMTTELSFMTFNALTRSIELQDLKIESMGEYKLKVILTDIDYATAEYEFKLQIAIKKPVPKPLPPPLPVFVPVFNPTFIPKIEEPEEVELEEVNYPLDVFVSSFKQDGVVNLSFEDKVIPSLNLTTFNQNRSSILNITYQSAFTNLSDPNLPILRDWNVTKFSEF